MWIVEFINRENGKVEVSDYASFENYVAARLFADREERSVRQLGWTAVVVWKE